MPTPKQQVKESIKEEKHSGDKYSVESLRANMSTGGGEPIPKGKKRTTQKRVLQPRDPDTGQFEFNSSALYGRKYPDRSKPDHAPIAARGWILNEGIKKGDKVNIDGKVWIAIESIDKQELINYFKKYNEGAGEFSSGNQKLSSKFIRKHGRQSKEEKAGMEAGKRVVGQVDMSALSKTSKAEMEMKMKESMQGFEPENWSTIPLSPIDAEKQAANEKFNAQPPKEAETPAEKPAEKPAEQPMEKGVGAGEGGSPEPEKPAEGPKKFSYDFDAMEKDLKGFYEANKEEIDKRVDAYNKKKGYNWSAAKYLKAILNKHKQKKG